MSGATDSETRKCNCSGYVSKRFHHFRVSGFRNRFYEVIGGRELGLCFYVGMVGVNLKVAKEVPLS